MPCLYPSTHIGLMLRCPRQHSGSYLPKLSCFLRDAVYLRPPAHQRRLAVPLARVWLLPRIQAGNGEGARESAREALRAGLHLVHQLLQHLQRHTHTSDSETHRSLP